MISEHGPVVDRLIAKVAASIDEYLWAAKNSDNPAISARFLNCANQREHAVKHLKAALKRLGGNTDDIDDAVSGGDRAMNTAFRKALDSNDEHGLEAEVVRQEGELLSEYDAILALEFDEQATHEIQQSLEIVKRSSI